MKLKAIVAVFSIAMAVSFTTNAAVSQKTESKCTVVAAAAAVVMIDRQSGMSRDGLVRKIEKLDNKVISKIALEFVPAVFIVPVAPTEEGKRAYINEITRGAYKGCVKGSKAMNNLKE